MTAKERRFVDEYLISGNATEAAISAGYAKRSAANTGWRLMRKAEISAAIADRAKAVANKADVTAERVLREYARLAFGDPRSVADWGPDGVALRPSSELTDEQAALIESVRETKDGVAFKLHSKVAALEGLAKHLGLFINAEQKQDQGPVYGVLLVPTPISAEQWSGVAQLQQRMLLDHLRRAPNQTRTIDIEPSGTPDPE